MEITIGEIKDITHDKDILGFEIKPSDEICESVKIVKIDHEKKEITIGSI